MSRLSLLHQEGALRSYFPGCEIFREGESVLTWIHALQPSPLSDTYRVKLHYSKGQVKAYVLTPKLKLAEGERKLPHVYSTERQQLCLYYPEKREWHAGMLFVQTIIPWMSEWLYFYEIWLCCGKWLGGGIEHSGAEPK
ncbi:hypothetical protein [uncultured Chitinophaga sp.]|jgi:hypothetical protein|uniref:hypothetical protein n=1 Tax=uncultured Chitinophaga sp. TaxID=339340 RepID=UPI002619837E|nr:hypothetical protein [uncultured Chitinophaga sp.]